MRATNVKNPGWESSERAVNLMTASGFDMRCRLRHAGVLGDASECIRRSLPIYVMVVTSDF